MIEKEATVGIEKASIDNYPFGIMDLDFFAGKW
jgi:hypothetical protein